MKDMTFAVGNYKIRVIQADDGTASIESDLKDGCPYCGETECYFSCDQSTFDDEQETEEETNSRRAYNAAIDGMESFILALVSPSSSFASICAARDKRRSTKTPITKTPITKTPITKTPITKMPLELIGPAANEAVHALANHF